MTRFPIGLVLISPDCAPSSHCLRNAEPRGKSTSAEISSAIPSAPQASIQPQHGLDGNMAFDGAKRHCAWNGGSRLILAPDDACAANRACGRMGRMIRETISNVNPASGKTMPCAWDDLNIAAETVVEDGSAEYACNTRGLDI